MLSVVLVSFISKEGLPGAEGGRGTSSPYVIQHLLGNSYPCLFAMLSDIPADLRWISLELKAPGFVGDWLVWNLLSWIIKLDGFPKS